MIGSVSADKTADSSASPSELVIGIVSSLGTHKDLLYEHLSDSFKLVDYASVRIRLMEWVSGCKRWAKLLEPGAPYDLNANARMTAGDEFCEAYRDKDAFAMLSMLRIVEERQKLARPERTVYVLDSLKRLKEVKRLREVYGPNFLLVGAYEPKERRILNVRDKIAASRHGVDKEQFTSTAELLVLRDEREHGQEFGQDVQDTFPECDVFFDVSDRDNLRATVNRFVEALFGHPCRTPTLDEYAMSQAFVASLRSSAVRQVGACIVDESGEILALGANEIPRPFGGQWWASEKNSDGRTGLDRSIDSNTEMIDGIVADLFKRLLHHKWLSKDLVSGLNEEDPAIQLVQKAKLDRVFKPVTKNWTDSLSQRARIEQVIEYLNVVHAEMAAIMSAVRRGVPVRGATLYTTTFPCHECARHIVAAGIRRVVFIEPYPKSRAKDLYYDAVAVDARKSTTHVPFEAYVGVAPRAYSRLFVAFEREKNGHLVTWEKVDRSKSVPRGVAAAHWYQENEQRFVRIFWSQAVADGLGPEDRLEEIGRVFKRVTASLDANEARPD